MTVKKFREDINGLRAIAVLSVVAFHFSSGALPGGFAGVDVFFVISGFLMTSIIMKSIESDTFSILKFLIARAKRIIPALVFTVLLVLAIGYLAIEPTTYKKLGHHALGSLLFVSNIIYQRESGYFDGDAITKILLHTWSLSVEWQFYVIYPIVLSVIARFTSKRNIKKFVVFSFLASLAWCAYLTNVNPLSSYYSFASRSWEMLMGGLIVLFPVSTTESRSRRMELVGLFVILLSVIFINERISWPGIAAAIPTAGAALIILANNSKSVLSYSIFQIIGKSSYSIYLMHWPVLALMHKFNVTHSLWLYLLITLVLSFACYSLVEKRRNYHPSMLIIYILAIAVSYHVSINGISSRVHTEQYKLSMTQFRHQYEGNLGIKSTAEPVYFNSSDNKFDYILIGDSFARHYYSYIESSGIRLVSFAIDGCKITKNFMRPINYSEEIKSICLGRYSEEVGFINKHHGKVVLISMAWLDGTVGDRISDNMSYKNDIISELDLFLNDIKHSGSEVYIIGNTQGSDRAMNECLGVLDLPLGKYLNSCDHFLPRMDNPVHKKLSQLAGRHKNVHFIDVTDALCDSEKCRIVDGAMPIYTDTAHLTRKYSNVVGNYIFRKIEESNR